MIYLNIIASETKIIVYVEWFLANQLKKKKKIKKKMKKKNKKKKKEKGKRSTLWQWVEITDWILLFRILQGIAQVMVN